jgi:3-hydroxy-D-aspartate aldolase
MRIVDSIPKRRKKKRQNPSASSQVKSGPEPVPKRLAWTKGVQASRPLASRLGPNAAFIGEVNARSRLWTPALILDLDAFEHNLDCMAKLARKGRKNLRPHAKTHKCIRIAREQLKRGAVGISVATVYEASVMVRAGIHNVLITSPVVGATKLEAISKLAEQSRQLMVVIDSKDGMTELESVFKRRPRSIGVLVDVDAGMRRTGTPSVRDALELAARVSMSNVLEFRGLQCYSGEVQHVCTAARRASVYREELSKLEVIVERLAKRGLTANVVSGGGTGTASIDLNCAIFTELQAGSYIFMDNQYNKVELFHRRTNPFKTSLFVQSMVLSNNHPGAASVDGGFKSFSADGPAPKIVRGAPRGSTYQFNGDEFGLLRFTRGKKIALGTKIEFVTPHCDPTVNLHDYYHCVRGQSLVDIWPVDARGTMA